MSLVIGTAGWGIAGKDAGEFGTGASALARYATRFGGVEINSSFHRPHRRATWERWAQSVPAAFRFAVKLPKTVSHERKLVDCEDLLARFLDEVGGLGGKLAVLLLQLPPKLAFDRAVAEPFLAGLARSSPARLACEPRHASWFERARGLAGESRDRPGRRRSGDRPGCGSAGRLARARLLAAARLAAPLPVEL